MGLGVAGAGCLLATWPGHGGDGALESVQVTGKTKLQTLTEHLSALTATHSCHREELHPMFHLHSHTG